MSSSILRRLDDDRRRVVAAHFVRPVARDVHGHLQRLGPAVLATWDPEMDEMEQFGWGVTPELARRVGLRAGDFEVEVGRRRDHLADPHRDRRDRPATGPRRDPCLPSRRAV